MLIEKMKAAMVACGVEPVLIEEAIKSASRRDLFNLPAERKPRISAKEAGAFFDSEFWPNVPKRDGGNPKEPARKKIVAALISGENPQEIMDGLARWKHDLAVRGKLGSEFVPQAITWINRKGWKDDPVPEPTRPGPAGPMGFFAAAAAIGARGEG